MNTSSDTQHQSTTPDPGVTTPPTDEQRVWDDDERVLVKKDRRDQSWEWSVGRTDENFVGYIVGGSEATFEEAVRRACCVHAEVFAGRAL